MTITEHILAGYHPVAIMHMHEITAGQLQQYLLCEASRVLGVCVHEPPNLAEGTVLGWAPRFRALGHMGLEGVP